MKVLVFHTRGLHLGYIGCYGNDWVDTPSLDQLATEGIVFDQHIADHPRTAVQDDIHVAQPGYLTGRYRFPAPTAAEGQSLAPLLFEVLASHGVSVLHVVEQHLKVDDVAGLVARELKAWSNNSAGLCWVDWPALLPPWNVPAEYLEAYFLESEDEESLTPWLDPPAGPFDDAGPDRERLQNSYAAQVSYFDAQLGVVLDDLAARGGLDDTLLVVTASAGLPLGEHGYVGPHRSWLHEELVHVPLIIRLPQDAEAGLRITALTQPVDLPATILSVLGLAAKSSQGFDLIALIRGQKTKVRSWACSGLAIGDSMEWALRTLEWAYLLPLSTPPDDRERAPQLFLKPEDRWEVNDVRQHHLETADGLDQALREFVARPE